MQDIEERYSILVVEDDELVRTIYLERLSQETHFQVDFAVDGMHALQKLRVGNYDLVFTGIDMPRMSGFDLIREMQRDNHLHNIPIVVSSHLGRIEDREQSQTLGIQHFLVRGEVSPNQVANILYEVLTGKSVGYTVFIDTTKGEALDFLEDNLGGACVEGDQHYQQHIRVVPVSQKDGKTLFEITKICTHK